VAGIANGDDNG
jgi:hypothetical protein